MIQQPWQTVIDYDNMRYTESKLIVDLGNGKYRVYEKGSNMEIGSAESGIIVTKNYAGPHFTLLAKASLINFHRETHALESMDFELFYAHAQAEISKYYVGAEANLVLMSSSVSIFDLKLALGADTGIGIKDDSVAITVIGTGITVGRKMGISVLGTEFSIDFGKLFN
jgi:hypothetical protein